MESNVRAPRQQFGVPQGSCVTLVYTVFVAPSKADVCGQRPTPYFHPFGVALQEGPWTTGVKMGSSDGLLLRGLR
jgi:hypothetical protein